MKIPANTIFHSPSLNHNYVLRKRRERRDEKLSDNEKEICEKSVRNV